MAAAARAQEASSSMSRCTYDVFLSFREDTRKNFTSHLYAALKRAGIHTFLDDHGIERGENILAELRKAIQESKISIIVFSKDYASSTWCLNELMTIMERKRTVGHTVLPIFYDVDPPQVRKQTGSFAEAFAKHEKQFKEELDKVESWRAALRHVANLGGMVSDNRHESQFVQSIIQEIGNKLNRRVLNVPPYLVGLDSRVRHINSWVQDGSNDVGIATIYGIRGIGKTTIAKTIYNQNFDRFEGKSFLGNVRETTEQPNGLVRLQRQLLLDILKRKTSKIYNADEGIIKIKDAIRGKNVLLVLDDVDQLDQLNAIIGMWEWFHKGSKIIITTRYERLEGFNEVCKKFEVEQLEDDESLQLFSWHAFKQGHPTEGYMEWSRKAVHQCGGIPLTLQVLGSALYDRETKFWENTLQKLEGTPLALQVCDSKIQIILRISYNSLQHDRDLFLNIACFFIGKNKDYTVKILDRHDYSAIVGIQKLIDRCLLIVDENKKLMMHQLLRDMGREIIRQESIDNMGKRSRLWHHNDALIVLKEKTGTETVKGLTLDLRRLMEDMHGKTIVNLVTKTFKKMHKLELLQLNYVMLKGDYKDFSKNLRWLCWHGFPLESIPTNFYLENLVALDMRYSSLKYVWRKQCLEGAKFLAELRILNLSHSHSLVRTPNFSGLPSLERLIFKDCINLVNVDKSIADLEKLVFLNLKNCKNLRKLPRRMSMLKSLEELNLSGCLKLVGLPEDLRKMESLKVLYLDEIDPNQLLSTNGDINRLKFWLSLRKGPQSTGLPQSLVQLSLANCNLSDDAIFYGIVSLPSLKDLNLSGNPIHSLPESISGLNKLQFLYLNDCPRLKLLPKLPLSLVELSLDNCTSLERVPNLPFLPVLNFLTIYYCEKLVEVEGLFKLEPIKNTDIAVIKSLGLSNLESLESIEVCLEGNTTGVQMKTPLQVLYECGITSIYLPRSEVPDCFVLKTTGSFISFRVPPLLGHKIRGLNLCVLYAFDPEASCENDPYDNYAQITNKTKRMRWNYNPVLFAPPRAEEEDMLWLSQWNFGDQLDGGNEVDVSVVLPRFLHAKMCGICFVYKPEDKGFLSNTEETVRNAFPWYQTLTLTKAGTNVYSRCHHSFSFHRSQRSLLKFNSYTNDLLFKRNPEMELDTCLLCEDLERKFMLRRNKKNMPLETQNCISGGREMELVHLSGGRDMELVRCCDCLDYVLKLLMKCFNLESV